MQLGLSLAALKEKRMAKESRRKLQQKERKEKNRVAPERPEEFENHPEQRRTAPKQKKLSKEERTFLLDQAEATSPEGITGLTEAESKGLLKIVVNILNTIPYEPIKVIHFPPDRNPHRGSQNDPDADRRREPRDKPKQRPATSEKHGGQRRQ